MDAVDYINQRFSQLQPNNTSPETSLLPLVSVQISIIINTISTLVFRPRICFWEGRGKITPHTLFLMGECQTLDTWHRY